MTVAVRLKLQIHVKYQVSLPSSYELFFKLKVSPTSVVIDFRVEFHGMNDWPMQKLLAAVAEQYMWSVYRESHSEVSKTSSVSQY